MSARRPSSRRSAPARTGTWRLSDEVRSIAAPELAYCETFCDGVSFDHVAIALALSVDEAWVLQGSDAALHMLIMHEQTVLQGPHVEVLGSGLTVRVDRRQDLADRWPLLAASGGMGSLRWVDLLVVPLGCSPRVPAIGTFSLSRADGAGFTKAEVDEVVEFGRMLAGMLLARWQAVRDVDRLDGLVHDYRHLAAGMLASYLGVHIPQAMALMRARAFSEGRTLSELAADIVLSLGSSSVHAHDQSLRRAGGSA